MPAGRYVLFTQHLPEEFSLVLRDARGTAHAPIAEQRWAAAHVHDQTISSVGLHSEEPLDSDRFDRWITKLLRERGTDIFRTKGIVHFAGSKRRFVFQGVHMLLDGREDREWGADRPATDLVFIGRHLDRAELEAGFSSCRSGRSGGR